MLGKNIYDVLIEPIYSEKATIMAEQSKYSFKVAHNATKDSVKLAVEKLFNVKVESVNILKTHAKRKVFKGVLGFRSAHKKAIVTVAKGAVIEFTKGA